MRAGRDGRSGGWWWSGSRADPPHEPAAVPARGPRAVRLVPAHRPLSEEPARHRRRARLERLPADRLLPARRHLVDRRSDAAAPVARAVAAATEGLGCHDRGERRDHDAVPVAHDRLPARDPAAVAVRPRHAGRQHPEVVDRTHRGWWCPGRSSRARDDLRPVRATRVARPPVIALTLCSVPVRPRPVRHPSARRPPTRRPPARRRPASGRRGPRVRWCSRSPGSWRAIACGAPAHRSSRCCPPGPSRAVPHRAGDGDRARPARRHMADRGRVVATALAVGGFLMLPGKHGAAR